eukprot:2810067-Alexandrium_andersonii.AAC.1
MAWWDGGGGANWQRRIRKAIVEESRLPPWMKGPGGGSSIPKGEETAWFCSSCGAPHANADCQRCRACGKPRFTVSPPVTK